MADEQRSELEAGTEPDTANGTAEQAGETSELHALLEDARNKADENWNQCLRLTAEMDNLRKRNQRDLENAHKFALEKFAAELLPVRDSLEMGIAAADGDNVDPAKLKEGSELTLKMLSNALEKFGITEVNPQGQRFDPQFHEAMSMQPRADVEPNTVVTVVQKGYLLNERLLRPAMVIVSQAVPGATPTIDTQA